MTTKTLVFPRVKETLNKVRFDAPKDDTVSGVIYLTKAEAGDAQSITVTVAAPVAS